MLMLIKQGRRSFLKSRDQVLEYIIKNPIDYMMVGGDVWHSPQMLKEGTGIEPVFGFFKEASNHVKWIIIIKGNDHHDAPGSIKILNGLRPNIYATEKIEAIAFENNKPIILSDINAIDELGTHNPEIIFNLIPYPNKAFLVEANQARGIRESNDDYGDIFDGLMEGMFGLINNKYNCPKVMLGHMNISSARISNGQTMFGNDINY